MSETVQARTAKRAIDLPRDKAVALRDRLANVEGASSAREAADTITRGLDTHSPPFMLTHAQKLAAIAVLDAWLQEEGEPALGEELMLLRDELYADTAPPFTPGPS